MSGNALQIYSIPTPSINDRIHPVEIQPFIDVSLPGSRLSRGGLSHCHLDITGYICIIVATDTGIYGIRLNMQEDTSELWKPSMIILSEMSSDSTDIFSLGVETAYMYNPYRKQARILSYRWIGHAYKARIAHEWNLVDKCSNHMLAAYDALSGRVVEASLFASRLFITDTSAYRAPRLLS